MLFSTRVFDVIRSGHSNSGNPFYRYHRQHIVGGQRIQAGYLPRRQTCTSQKQKARILQRDLELDVCLLEEEAHPLKAPTNGEMIRTIHENISCKAFYRFRKSGCTLFSLKTNHAAFEYEYPF